MGITPGTGEPIIEPLEILRSKEARVPCERFILTFTKYTFGHIKRLLGSVEKVRLYVPATDSIKGEYKGVEVCATKPYFGAVASAMALELLIATGARKFIVVGEAGALHPSLRIGDILIPTWGIREEGVSYHYMPPDYTPRPSPKLISILEEELKRIKGRRRMRVIKGGVWTTDAPFRETRDKVRRYSKMGVLGVEMEATALMTIAEYRNVDLAVVLSISDELYGEKWNPGFGTRKLRRTERLVVEAALNAIVKA